jgi:hypothetical protein
MGDGSLIGCYWNGKWKRGYRLKIQHSAKQKVYVFWKYKAFRNWVLKPPYFEAKTKSWRFQTISHPEFSRLRNEFYTASGKKTLPPWIGKELRHPLVCAVWFMDDGADMPNGGCTLNTQSFTYEEHKRLQRAFKKYHAFESSIHRDKNKYRLYFLKSSAHRFEKMIRRYLLRSMRYKFA